MKRRILLIGIVIILVFVSIGCGGGNGGSTQPRAQAPAPVAEAAEPATEQGPETPVVDIQPEAPQPRALGVTGEAFALLRNGMSIAEVQEIIGVTPFSETNTEMLGTTTTIIMWVGSGFSSITVMFTNGSASSISQMGLQVEPHQGEAPPTIAAGGVNAETFALLRNGMSISEVQEIIGVAPSSESTTELLGTTTTMIMWIGSGFSSITVIFTNGYASSISQMGL